MFDCHFQLTQELTTLLHALATLGHRPSGDWMAAAAGAVAAAAAGGSMSPRQLSTTMWALAVLRQRPSRALMAAWALASLQTMAHASAYDVSQSLWAVAKLHRDAVMDAAAAAEAGGGGGGAGGADGDGGGEAAALWPVVGDPVLAAAEGPLAGGWRCGVPVAWLAAAMERCCAVMRPAAPVPEAAGRAGDVSATWTARRGSSNAGSSNSHGSGGSSCKAQDVCNALWAVAQLGLRPPRAWVLAVAAGALSSLPHEHPAPVLPPAGALPSPSGPHASTIHHHQQQQQQHYREQQPLQQPHHNGLAGPRRDGPHRGAASLPALSPPPLTPAPPTPPAAVATAAATAAAATGAATAAAPPAPGAQRWRAGDVAGMMWALAKLRVRPPPGQMLRLCRAAAGAAARGELGEQHCANVLWALAVLRYRPPPDVLRALGARAAQLATRAAAGAAAARAGAGAGVAAAAGQGAARGGVEQEWTEHDVAGAGPQVSLRLCAHTHSTHSPPMGG